MTLDVRHERPRGLLDDRAELELLGSGFRFTEGPVWVADGEYLLFSDSIADRRYRWDERSGVREVAGPANTGNGMTLDADGRLLVCEGGTGAVARMDPSGSGSGREVVAGSFSGRRLNSPNDVVVGSDGFVYFTDPWWSRLVGLGLERELDFQGVYRVVPGEEPQLLADDLEFPNGLCFSPDEEQLYVNDSASGSIRALEGGAWRRLADVPRDDTGHVDGMKCDEHGNVWVTGPRGIWVLDPDGRYLGILETPARAGNLHWGGPDWSWLFLCCTSQLFRVRTRVSGRREPFMH